MAIVNDVLDFNKIEEGNITFDHTPFNLEELLFNICGSQKIKAGDKGLSFNLQIDEFLHEHEVVGDAVRLTQVLYNLISNAVKFTLSGSVWVKVGVVELDKKKR